MAGRDEPTAATVTSNVHGAVYVFKYGRWFRLLHCGCCWAVVG